MRISDRLQQLGIVLPQPPRIPPGVVLPFGWVRVCGKRALISGHGPTNPDGSFAKPLGRVGSEVTKEEAYRAARLTGLAMLASLKRELVDWSSFATHAEARAAVFEWITWYNHERLHTSLRMRSPHDFEQTLTRPLLAA